MLRQNGAQRQVTVQKPNTRMPLPAYLPWRLEYVFNPVYRASRPKIFLGNQDRGGNTNVSDIPDLLTA